ncbi:MAG: MmgE/PrpD family protein [Betaproteobacteria bacterium]
MAPDPLSAGPSAGVRLAGFLAACRWEELPAAVRHEAKRSLLNYFAVALAGSRQPAADKAAATLAPFSGAARARVIGRSERFDTPGAAFLNAMNANVFDFDDTHPGTIIHPTAPVAPALFAHAESDGLSGRDLLLAFVLGVEAECRIGNAMARSHYRRGWHITSTCGVFGAAAAMGRVLGLDARQMNWAFGNASVQAGGLVETLGTMAKSISVGNAARNGMLSALLAREGFSGPDHPLDGARGYLRVADDAPDFEALTRGLGSTWELLSNTYKPYPCGVVLNPVLEACIDLSSDPGLSLGEIERIEIVGLPLLRERTDRPGVRSGREAQVSAQHGVPVALSRGKAGLEEFSDEAVADPRLRELGAKVAFVDDDSYAVDAAKVIVRMSKGRVLERHVAHARGGIARPLSDADLEKKLAELLRFSGARLHARALCDAIWALDGAADAGAVMALACPVAA